MLCTPSRKSEMEAAGDVTEWCISTALYRHWPSRGTSHKTNPSRLPSRRRERRASSSPALTALLASPGKLRRLSICDTLHKRAAGRGTKERKAEGEQEREGKEEGSGEACVSVLWLRLWCYLRDFQTRGGLSRRFGVTRLVSGWSERQQFAPSMSLRGEDHSRGLKSPFRGHPSRQDSFPFRQFSAQSSSMSNWFTLVPVI